ncbi:MAG: rhodanese-like domain-containing protein [Bacillota bacterium]
MKRWLIALTLISALLTGCSGAKQEPAQPSPSAAAPAKAGTMVTISVNDLLKRVQAGEKPLIIDVREQSEWDAGHIEGARLMPLGTIESAISKAGIAKDQEVILICRSGNRSAQAYRKLEALGYTNLKNVTGGMNEWAKVGPVTR